MDELKLAFETVIVGLLAIPWLLILFYLGSNILGRKDLLTKAREFLTDGHQSFALIGPLIIGLAYCAGTILFPFADDYFNEPRGFPVHIRGDDAIRVETYAKIYFDPEHEYYDLREEDFPGLANAKKTIGTIKTAGPQADKISKGDYEKLTEAVHSIYNYQKYYDYNSDKGYEVLKPLESRIIVLRGAVLNGLFLLGALLLLFSVTLLKVIFRLWKELLVATLPEVILRPKERIQGLVILLFLGLIVWALCSWGAWGVAQAEVEYDKHVVGIFYGSLVNAKIHKPIEQQSPGKNAGELKGK
jgi:hypothetical protein